MSEHSFWDFQGSSERMPTGFIKLDEITGGLRRGELFAIAGRTGAGKSALALNIGHYIAHNRRNPLTTVMLSFEMSKSALLTRMLCGNARVDQAAWRAGFSTCAERKRLESAAAELETGRFYIDDSTDVDFPTIQGKLRRMQKDCDLGLVIFDYLQLMTSGSHHANRAEELNGISILLKGLAKELNVPIIVVSQLASPVEENSDVERPQLHDLEACGCLDQHADIVCFVFREEYYKQDREDLKGQAELIIAKQRNGPVGKVPLLFMHQFTKFENPIDAFGEGDGN